MGKTSINSPFYVLSLDGGGSLGVYTLGVLTEIEKMLKKPLHEVFDLVYGTSTGAIIASLIALGKNQETIKELYFSLAPDVMKRRFASTRTTSLKRHASKIFGNKEFTDFLVNVGIVCTNTETSAPLVFKSDLKQADGRKDSFQPGFGVSIAEAVTASCAARPYFKKQTIETTQHGDFKLIDGGFLANNPTLFALADAIKHLKIPLECIRVLNVSTGSYPSRTRAFMTWTEVLAPTIVTLAKASSNTVEIIRKLFMKDVRVLRIDDSFTDNSYRTDFLESRLKQLTRIFQLGCKSFGDEEQRLRNFFETS